MRFQDDYVVCIVGGRHQFFPDTDNLSGEQLRDIAARTVADWPDQAADLIRQGDAEAFFPVHMYSSVPGTLDTPTNVTLLGDAVHAMTPTLGRGANLAMRDAVLLGRALRTVAAGDNKMEAQLIRVSEHGGTQDQAELPGAAPLYRFHSWSLTDRAQGCGCRRNTPNV